MVRLKLSKRTIASSCVAARPESLKYFAPPARKLRHDDRDVAFARDHRILAVGIALKRCIRLNSVTVLFQFTFNLQCTSQAYPGISPAMMCRLLASSRRNGTKDVQELLAEAINSVFERNNLPNRISIVNGRRRLRAASPEQK
jgi:hypothetical protein